MGFIETTDAWTWADLSALAKARRDHPSFHLFSESHLRGKIFNLRQSETLGPLTIEGNLLILGLAGTVSVNVGNDARSLGPLCEMVLNPGTRLRSSPTPMRLFTLSGVHHFRQLVRIQLLNSERDEQFR